MKALLSVSFGTSYEATREKTIDAIEVRLKAAFPGRAFYSAWTSGRIVAKVRAERGEQHDTLDEALARLSADGVTDLVVSTMCLMNGHEMAKIVRAVDGWLQEGESRVARIALPLLSDADDRHAMAKAIIDEFAAIPEDDALLLMGHGSQDAPTTLADGTPYDANAVYSQIQDEFHALGRPRFFMGTVEGTPTFEDAAVLIEACAPACVHLAPFMIVAGDHATNDLAGDDEDSWKNMLSARGLKTDAVLRGLGEYPGVQQLVCDHALAAETGKAL